MRPAELPSSVAKLFVNELPVKPALDAVELPPIRAAEH